MNEGINALTNLLLQTSGETMIDQEGNITTVPDTSMLKYRFLDIDADNFSAFLKQLFDLKALKNTFARELTPMAAQVLLAEIELIINHYIVAATGQCSQQGKFYKALLKDEHTAYNIFKETTDGKKPLAERIPSFQGDDQRGGNYR